MNDLNLLYFDKLNLLAIKKCMYVHNDFVYSYEYETGHGNSRIIDKKNKLFEACLDKVYALHKIFDDEFTNNYD
jgi:hypothetical protein